MIIGGIECATIDRCNIIILYNSLRNIAELAVINSKYCVIIILDGVNATRKCTVIDSQLRRILTYALNISSSVTLFRSRIIVVPICYQTRIVAILLDGYILVNCHNTMV